MKTKDLLLQFLYENPYESFSGPKLGERFGVTRACINKCFKELKAESDCIIADSKGYAYIPSYNTVNTSVIKQNLCSGLKNITIHSFTSIASTNAYARHICIDNASDFETVIAREQTRGKGRHGNSFDSPKDGLYMSVILKKPQHFDIIMPAKCVSKALEAYNNTYCPELCNTLSIVNDQDIYCNGNKCCGILTETMGEVLSATDYYVVGIGVTLYEKAHINELIALILNELYRSVKDVL